MRQLYIRIHSRISLQIVFFTFDKAILSGRVSWPHRLRRLVGLGKPDRQVGAAAQRTSHRILGQFDAPPLCQVDAVGVRQFGQEGAPNLALACLYLFSLFTGSVIEVEIEECPAQLECVDNPGNRSCESLQSV